MISNQSNQLPVDNVDSDTTKDINLYHLVKYYLGHWIWIVALSVAGLLIGLVYTYFIQVPLYKSDATLAIVLSTTDSSTSTTLGNYVELFKSRRVLDPVINELKIDETYDQFASTFDVSNDKSTDIILVSATSQDQKQSTAIVSSTIASFEKEVKSIYGADNVRIVDGASQPNKPYNVKTLIQLAIATAAGFIVSIIGLFFVYDFKQSQSDNLSEDSQEADASQRKNKKSLYEKQAIEEEKRKKEIEKIRSDKAEAKRLAREAKQAKRLADKKASARRKTIAKKAKAEKVAIRKDLKKNELEKRLKLRQERKIENKKAHLLHTAEQKDIRKIRMTNMKLSLKSAMFPLKKKIAEIKAAQSLRHEAHQAEHTAKHEERMAKIEEMRASSLERRMAAITKSAELAKRIEKENKAVEEKNNSMAKPAMTQSNDNIFYASIKSKRLNRRGQPYEFTDDAKTKHNLLNRIRRNRSK